ncbi:MAG: YihY/virulence factor BrkB family protein [Candidatus Dormibacteria bacterium]
MKAWLRRLRRWLPVRVAARYLNRGGPNQATLVAWNMLFSFFPIMVLAATLASLIPSRGAAIGRGLDAAIASALPGGRGQAVARALSAFHHNSGLLAVIGGLGLLWGGSALFGAMDQAFAALADAKPRDFLTQKLMSFGMIILFAGLVVPVVLSSSLLAVLEKVPGIPSVLAHGPGALVLQILVAVLIGTVLFSAIYALVPRQRRRARAVLPGALVAAVLFEALSLLFPLYFRLAHGFSTYGTTFSLFFLILTYVFFLAQITVVGFAVVLERSAGPGTHDGPSSGAANAQSLPAAAPPSESPAVPRSGS